MKKTVKREYATPKVVVVGLKIEDRLMKPGWAGQTKGNQVGCVLQSN